jgi:hypothetical protein
MESAQEITEEIPEEIPEEITCERCEEAREIISLGLCENCLDERDRYEEDRIAEYIREEV